MFWKQLWQIIQRMCSKPTILTVIENRFVFQVLIWTLVLRSTFLIIGSVWKICCFTTTPKLWRYDPYKKLCFGDVKMIPSHKFDNTIYTHTQHGACLITCIILGIQDKTEKTGDTCSLKSIRCCGSTYNAGKTDIRYHSISFYQTSMLSAK